MGISMFLLPLNSNLFFFGLLQIGIGIGRGFFDDYLYGFKYKTKFHNNNMLLL